MIIDVCKISLSFRFRISLSDMTNYKSAFSKVCRIKNRQTFKSMPICNSSYHDLVWYAELRIGILLKVCRFVIRHITQTDTETETELLRRHIIDQGCIQFSGLLSKIPILLQEETDIRFGEKGQLKGLLVFL